MSRYFSNFQDVIAWTKPLLLEAPIINRGRWQGIDTAGHPDLDTHEVVNYSISVPVPNAPIWCEEAIQPNLPWARDHFEERVSRVPSNPGEQYKNWPWWHSQERPTQAPGLPVTSSEAFKFTHTYQERFWPKQIPIEHSPYSENDYRTLRGIRYAYGDLDDVVSLLVREPYTRQATFPIFFPEDTGAVHGGRIPCTLHYHFLMMMGEPPTLDLYYPIRSCDFVRHFRDDLYMACRLLLWVLGECMIEYEKSKMLDPRNMNRRNNWKEIKPGYLHFTAYSLHVHRGDLHRVR